LVDIF
jgi:alpha-ketoglutarate-dependent taurine dioxygenase